VYRLKLIRERFGDLMINVDSFIKNFRHLPQDVKTTVMRQCRATPAFFVQLRRS